MRERTYTILLDDNIVAQGVTMTHVSTFVDALFEKYWAELDIRVSIEREVFEECECREQTNSIH